VPAASPPRRPLSLVVFTEEEGGRFGVPCLGSRLMSGSLDADVARRLTDRDGVSLASAVAASGVDPAHLGEDADALAGVGCFVELHVEQGRLLGTGCPALPPVAVASSILAHGRWRFTVTGTGNHAGTTEVADRRDPMLPARRRGARRPARAGRPAGGAGHRRPAGAQPPAAPT